MTKVCNNDTKGYPYKDIPEEEYKIKVTVLQVLLSIIFFGMILAILSMQALASPLNLEVSIKGVQNGDTAEQSIPACFEKGHFCGRIGLICCDGLTCKLGPGFTRTCQ